MHTHAHTPQWHTAGSSTAQSQPVLFSPHLEAITPPFKHTHTQAKAWGLQKGRGNADRKRRPILSLSLSLVLRLFCFSSICQSFLSICASVSFYFIVSVFLHWCWWLIYRLLQNQTQVFFYLRALASWDAQTDWTKPTLFKRLTLLPAKNINLALILCGWSYTAFGFGFLTACVLDLLLLECVVPWGSGVCVCVLCAAHEL